MRLSRGRSWGSTAVGHGMVRRPTTYSGPNDPRPAVVVASEPKPCGDVQAYTSVLLVFSDVTPVVSYAIDDRIETCQTPAPPVQPPVEEPVEEPVVQEPPRRARWLPHRGTGATCALLRGVSTEGFVSAGYTLTMSADGRTLYVRGLGAEDPLLVLSVDAADGGLTHCPGPRAVSAPLWAARRHR